MCTDFTDIINDMRTVLSQVKNNASGAPQNDSDISPIQWYRFVDHVTKEPMKVCCASCWSGIVTWFFKEN